MSTLTQDDNNTIRKPIRLMIATPCYGGQCFVEYFESLMSTINYLKHEYNIECKPVFLKNDSLITRARNNLVAKFMAQKEFTHLMFIDADITWDPRDVYKLLTSNLDIVGGIYPYKKYNWDVLKPDYYSQVLKSKNKFEHNKEIDDLDFIKHNLVRYNLNYSNNMKVKNNVLKVKDLATGFMMLKREVFEELFECFPDLKYQDDCGYLTEEENKYAYALFDGGVVDGRYQSEDWLFCHRWQAVGGEIFANIGIDLTHIGKNNFEGRFMSSLKIE
jgi:hypothetical protein